MKPSQRLHRLAPARAGALAIGVLLASAGPARPYSYQSVLAPGCHERITMQSLRAVRAALPTAPLVPPDSNERALIRDVPYQLDGDMTDLTGASITIGARDNDLKGRGGTQLDQLAEVHGDPAAQREHCMRAAEDDEPSGSEHALEVCKAFIREKVASALEGLDANGLPDPERRLAIDVTLALRGKVSATLPRFWIEIGRAMHTLQDAFSHTFRSPDRLRVRAVLNWIDYVNLHEVETRDGPTHRNGLDQCDGLDPLRALNLGVATEASTALLRTALDPALSRQGKLAAVDLLLDQYISFEAGCTAANRWCDAPENQYAVGPSCGCSSSGPASGGVLAILGLAIGAARLGRRRRGVRALTAILGAAALLSVGPARAASETAEASQPSVEGKKAEVVEEKHQASAFGLSAALSGSISGPALGAQLGVRYRLSERWTVGLDAELNAWYGMQGTSSLRMGAFNGYATAIFRTPLRFEALNLRSTATLGTSVLLIDLYGAPSGSTGLWVGLVPLGIEWKFSSSVYLVFDALGLALPVPHLTGVPFAYSQYRTSIGLEVSL